MAARDGAVGNANSIASKLCSYRAGLQRSHSENNCRAGSRCGSRGESVLGWTWWRVDICEKPIMLQ